MTTYYVSPSGSNANNGLTTITPWLTLAYAQANTTSGDEILHLSGGTWSDQAYSFSSARSLGVYNGSTRAVFDYDGSDGGTYFALVSLAGANSSIDSIDTRNNLSGNDQTDGGRGITITGDNCTVNNCRVYNVGANAITRDFAGDNLTITNTIIENIAALWTSGIYSGGISAAGASNSIDGYTVTDCQAFEVHGEAINVYSQSASVRCSSVVITDNDVCGGHSAGIYVNGCDDAQVARNIVTGTTNTNYHRVTGYTGYGLGQDVEADYVGASYNNNDIRWSRNLVAFCSPGFYTSSGYGTQTQNMLVAHNTFVDCEYTLTSISSSANANNIFRQNASLLFTGGTAHYDQVSGCSSWTKNENFWEGGGEHADLNDASDFSDTAWLPFTTSGWQSIAAIGDVVVDDFRPTTQVLGTQYTDPDTSANWTDIEATADFREAGAVASQDGVETPPPASPLPPSTPQTPAPLGRLFVLPRTAPTNLGSAIPGAKLYFYRTGTDTPQNTYSDSALTVPNPNPVIADSAGVFPPIYLDPASGYAYRAKLTTNVELQVWLEDDVTAETDDVAQLLQGRFTAFLNGYSTKPTPLIEWRIVANEDGSGRVAYLKCISGGTGTSDATDLSLWGLPTALVPASGVLVPCVLTDDSNSVMGAAQIAASGSSITFLTDAALSSTGFTNTGTKGLPVGWAISYSLT